MHNLANQRIAIIRDDLTEKCSSVLLGYRKECAAATRNSQVSLGMHSHLLPFDRNPNVRVDIAHHPRGLPSPPCFHLGTSEKQALERSVQCHSGIC